MTSVIVPTQKLRHLGNVSIYFFLCECRCSFSAFWRVENEIFGLHFSLGSKYLMISDISKFLFVLRFEIHKKSEFSQLG